MVVGVPDSLSVRTNRRSGCNRIEGGDHYGIQDHSNFSGSAGTFTISSRQLNSLQ